MKPVKMDAPTTKAFIGCTTGFIVALLVMVIGMYITGEIPGVPPWITIPLWIVVGFVVANIVPSSAAQRIADEEYEDQRQNPGFMNKAIGFLYGEKDA